MNEETRQAVIVALVTNHGYTQASAELAADSPAMNELCDTLEAFSDDQLRSMLGRAQTTV